MPEIRRLTEAGVEKHISDWLGAHGWRVTKTDAAMVRRGKNARPALPIGFPDMIATHPKRPAIYIEAKKSRARTERNRKIQQTAWAAVLRNDGYLVYHAADGDPDPIGSWDTWATENISGGS